MYWYFQHTIMACNVYYTRYVSKNDNVLCLRTKRPSVSIKRTQVKVSHTMPLLHSELLKLENIVSENRHCFG